MTRREAILAAAALGASLAWRDAFAASGPGGRRERRDLFPQGVASADPYPESVLLWTRRPYGSGEGAKTLLVEVARDSQFRSIVSSSRAAISQENDWTCRVLAAGLAPGKVYWYRFVDDAGNQSRPGRTLTAPAAADPRAVRFAFVSCQNVTQGASTAYRRMIWEDERAGDGKRLDFVLHLGDFVYEVVWYPEDRPQGMYARRLRDVVRYPQGEKIDDFHVPATLDDYRFLYRGYLTDPDLQDARARWPFVCMWDNHEFSWKGWQTQQNFHGQSRPAQTRKAAASQAWFEYQPARVVKEGVAGDRYVAPAVHDAPLGELREDGLGLEPGNLAILASLKLYRTLRFGRHVELILTDNRSFRSEPVCDRPEAVPFAPKDFPAVFPEDALEILDAGRACDSGADGKPPATIHFGGAELPNPRRNAPPQSMLGAEQKAWLFDRLRASQARWKLWGNSVAMLDWRIDFQNLPAGTGPRWPSSSYAQLGSDDWSGYRHERAEILDFVRREGIHGFATLCGDRHAFLAGLLSPTLPPKPFAPVGVEFVTGSISAPGIFEALEHRLPPDSPLRPAYLYQRSPRDPVEPAINLSILHGVRASLALAKTGDVHQALAARNPDVAPHLSFCDTGGHGYAVVRASAGELAVEFVCIPRPLERSDRADGGPLAYRVLHRVIPWKPGTAPRLMRSTLEGTPPLGL